jgi:hypothetical protein
MNITFGNPANQEKIVNQTYSTISVCSSTNSLSSIIGSVTSYITEYFKSKFPESFFKETYISTTMAASAIQKDYFEVKKRPYLFIQPQFDLTQGYMGDLPTLFTDTSWVYLKKLRKNYNLIFEDQNTGIRIFNAFKRTKINFRIGIRVNSELQGWNTISYIDQNFQTNGWFFLNKVFVQTQVPPFIIQNIANRLNYNLNENADLERMEDFMLQYSYNGIYMAKDLSTGNNRFMFRYPANILINYPDMSNQNRNMRQNVIQNSQIEYNITAELWTPSTFIMELDNMERFKNVKLTNPNDYEDGTYRFSLVMNEDYIPYTKDNRNILMKRNFLPEVNVEYDEVDLKSVLPLNVHKACDLLKKYKIKMSKVFTIDLYINGRLLFPENYEVDEKDLILKTKNPMVNTTYTVVCYADMGILNRINLLMGEDSKSEKELDQFLKDLKNSK